MTNYPIGWLANGLTALPRSFATAISVMDI